MTTNLVLPLLSSLALCLGLSAPATASSMPPTVDFTTLIEHPERLQGHVVSVVGVADVDGISFVIFQPPHKDLRRSIFVGQKAGKPQYNNLDRRWVKATGSVTLDEENVFACKLFLKSVQPLPRKAFPSDKLVGVFVNEGSDEATVEIYNKAGELEAKVSVAPKQLEKTAITEGSARLLSRDGKVWSTARLDSEASAAPGFFEKSTRSLYFRIRDGALTPIPAKEGARLYAHP